MVLPAKNCISYITQWMDLWRFRSLKRMGASHSISGKPKGFLPLQMIYSYQLATTTPTNFHLHLGENKNDLHGNHSENRRKIHLLPRASATSLREYKHLLIIEPAPILILVIHCTVGGGESGTIRRRSFGRVGNALRKVNAVTEVNYLRNSKVN